MPGRSRCLRNACALASMLLGVVPIAAASAQAELQSIQVCVLQNGVPQNVTALYNPTTGDSLDNVSRRSFSEVYPVDASYAAAATWYINGDSLGVLNRRFVKYGLPRVLGTTEIVKRGTYRGVSVFVEAGTAAATIPEVIYVPVRPGCEFQPYQIAPRRPPSD